MADHDFFLPNTVDLAIPGVWACNADMNYGEKVAKLLAERDRSQADLATAVGTSQQQVSTWVSKGVIPSTKYVLATARYLGVTADYLLDDSQEEPPQGLSEAERLFLVAVREMGYEKAMRVLVRSIPDDAGQKERATVELAEQAGPSPQFWTGVATYTSRRPVASEPEAGRADPTPDAINKPR